ncbi:MAG: ATP-binding cassette domain-containing protein [Clostridia bacterium]
MAPQQPTASFVHQICADEVSYTYPSRSEPALHGVSVCFHRAQLVAIVGHNGAGKTTLVRCLLGQLSPSTGRITVDGEPLVVGPSWRNLVAYVPQRLTPLDVTIRQYVTLGADVPEDDLQNALERVGAEWALPVLDMRLGFTAHSGTQISTGQRQLLGLARVLLRPSVRLIILDEPYTGLDTSHVTRLLECCRDLSRDRLVLIVAHRDRIAEAADYVVWMDEGHVRAQGPAASLQSLCEYRTFWASSTDVAPASSLARGTNPCPGGAPSGNVG